MSRLLSLEIHQLRLPFRVKFSHAAAERSATDAIVVAAVLADGTIGYGEGLPREYVTGETAESVLREIPGTLAPRLRNLAPRNFPELLEIADNLPHRNHAGAVINTARCAVELALLDAYSRHFHTPLSQIIGWLGVGVFSSLDVHPIRVSGVLDAAAPERLARRYRLMRLGGLEDFKVKMGTQRDEETLDFLNRKLRKPLAAGRITLRADANGAWDIDTALAMSEKLAELDAFCLEEPLARNDQAHWRTLADLSKVPIMADESLLTLENGKYLAENDLVDFFNIRISKNGGLIPAIRLAELAIRYHRGYQLGAMVGESGILAAAGWHFLQMVPAVCFTEIGYGTFLLRQDLARPQVRFGWRGRLPQLHGPGLGVEVLPRRLAEFSLAAPIKIPLAE